MQWHILEKKKAEKILIATKTSGGETELFSVASSEVKSANLSFYNHFVLYRLVNYMTMPMLTMDFLSDGTKFHHLDGTNEAIKIANNSGYFNLSEDNIIDYLNFYYANVNDDEGDIYLIENPEDLPFMDSLDDYQQKSIKSHHKDVEIENTDKDGEFVINTTMFNTGGLMQAKIKVNKLGIPTIIKQHLLLSDAIHSYAIKEQGI